MYKNQLKLLNDSIIKQNESLCSGILKSSKNICVYMNGYIARLVKAIEADFPLLKHYLGEEKFSQLAKDFIAKNPPKHWDLNLYPLPFSKVVKENIAKDIAKLEGAILQVFWAEESSQLSLQNLAKYSPEDLMQKQVFVLKPASKLLSLNYNVNDFLANFRTGNLKQKTPKKQKQYLFIVRTNNEVKRHALQKNEYLLLKNIQKGMCLENAVSSKIDIQSVLVNWIQEGFFK